MRRSGDRATAGRGNAAIEGAMPRKSRVGAARGAGIDGGRGDHGQPEVRQYLQAAASAAGLSLAESQVVVFERYLATLLLWRRRLPLVSQTAVAEIVTKHVEDSLALLPHVASGARVVDLGTGAGFPGMVVAIARSDAAVHLVESQRRKVSFLLDVVRQTGLGNVAVVEGRAEGLQSRDDFRGGFDVAVSRAVWPAREFFAIARPLLRPGGCAVAMKTRKDGLAGAAGYEAIEAHEYRLSGGEERVLLLALADRCT